MEQNDVAEQPAGWPNRLSRVIAAEVRRRRIVLGMSAQQLADECARLGYPIARAVLSHLENGRRENVTVAELLVLSKALGTEPVFLLAPVGFHENVEILPNVHMPVDEAVSWISGDETKNADERDGWPTAYKILRHEKFLSENLERVLEEGLVDPDRIADLKARLDQAGRRSQQLLYKRFNDESELAAARKDPGKAELAAQIEERIRQYHDEAEEVGREASRLARDVATAEHFGGDLFEPSVQEFLYYREEGMRKVDMVLPPLPPLLAQHIGEETAT